MLKHWRLKKFLFHYFFKEDILTLDACVIAWREEIAKIKNELASTVAQLRIAELTAARLEAEKKELVYQLDGTRKQVRALRKRSRRH